MSEEDAKNLINLLKTIYNNIVKLPSFGEHKTYTLNSTTTRDVFIVNINRKSKNYNKYTIQARVQGSNVKLMRLDILSDNVPHRNSDGTYIYGPHLHIFKEGKELADAVEYKDDEGFLENCIKFLDSFHLIDYKLDYQSELQLLH